MRLKVCLDSSVFIYAFEFPESNSKKVIDLLNICALEAVISERVYKEVTSYFKKFYGKDAASKFRNYLIETCELLFEDEIQKEMQELKGKIKQKDLPQIASARHLGIKYLIAFDEDFNAFEEYVTPKRFIEILNLKPRQTEY